MMLHQLSVALNNKSNKKMDADKQQTEQNHQNIINLKTFMKCF